MRILVGALLGAWLSAGIAFAQNAPQPQDPAPAQPVRPHPAHVDALEQRVRLLTRELDLNAEQQHAVRQILLGQREQMKHIREDASIAPEDLAAAVRLAGEHTADRIRALLSEDQKKKYNRPLPDGALSTQANADVEGWLRTARRLAP